MKSATKEQKKQHTAHVERLRACQEAVLTAKEAMEDPLATLATAIQEFNEAASEANGFCEELAADIESYMDERSDAWREGDKAQEYDSWKSAVEDATVEELEDVANDILSTLGELDGSCDFSGFEEALPLSLDGM